MTTFNLSVSDDKLPGDPSHDPEGPDIQFHDLPDGSGLMTLSAAWIEAADWRVGDDLVWTIDPEVGSATIRNLGYERRHAPVTDAPDTCIS